jgi:hypothetical protein
MGRKSRDSRRSRVAAEAAPADAGRDRNQALAALALGWVVPGGGHLWLARRQKGVVFLLAIPVMFAFGLGFGGRLFPFDSGQPLVLLAAFADLGNGLPYLLARVAGLGEGRVVAASFEYGNTFIIVSGLLNMLVSLDAYDVALGRR